MGEAKAVSSKSKVVIQSSSTFRQVGDVGSVPWVTGSSLAPDCTLLPKGLALALPLTDKTHSWHALGTATAFAAPLKTH